jgi:O-antigen/teichoic acid export membrane protein
MVRRVVLLSLAFYTLLSLLVAALVLPTLSQIPHAFHVPDPAQSAARGLLLGAVILFALSNYTLVFRAVLQGLQRLEVANIAGFVSQAAYLALLVLAWLRGWGPAGVVAATTSLYLVQTVLLGVAIIRYLPSGVAASPWVNMRSLLSYGGQIEVIVLADFVALAAPKLLAGVLLGASAAGRLDIAMRLPLAASAVVLPILPPLLPAASRLSTLRHATSLQDLNARATRYLAVLTLPIFAGVFVFGPPLISNWLGPSAAHLDISIRLLTVALLAHTLPGAATALAMGVGLAGLVARYKMLLLVITALLLFPAAKFLGLDGISGAILVGFIVSFLYLQFRMTVLVGRVGRRQMERALLRATGATVASTACGFFIYWLLMIAQIGFAPWLAAVGAAGIYAVLIIRVGIVKRDDVLDLLGPPLATRLLRLMRSSP